MVHASKYTIIHVMDGMWFPDTEKGGEVRGSWLWPRTGQIESSPGDGGFRASEGGEALWIGKNPRNVRNKKKPTAFNL